MYSGQNDGVRQGPRIFGADLFLFADRIGTMFRLSLGFTSQAAAISAPPAFCWTATSRPNPGDAGEACNQER
jgi:hypothetical protein